MADINVIVLPDGTEYPVSDYYLPIDISNPTDGQVLKYDATNHVWYNGNDAEGSSVFYGTSAPTSQLGANGNLYVKYTEGTGGASDTVDALYVKLDGAWCQISTGGGGGASSADQVSVDDTNLEYEADDVQEALEKIYKRMTLAEYEQLSHDEKYNGTIYFITDVKGANQNLTKEITNVPIATFDTDRAERLVKCVCEVASGASEINVTACGKNLFDQNILVDSTNWSYVDLSMPEGTYTMSTPDMENAYNDSNYPSLYCFILGEGSAGSNNNVYKNRPITVNLQSGKKIRLQYRKNNLYSIRDFNFQLEIDTATTYQAYNGNTYNIPFGETLSDTATYDVISGVLTRNDSTTKQLDSCNIVALNNETNNVYCDTGNTEVNYIMTVGKAIS